MGTKIEKSNAYFSKAAGSLPQIHVVLGFSPKALSLTYLGLPISGKRKSMGHCHKLIQPLECVLSRRKGGILSYGRRIQLVNWVFSGIFTY